MHVAPIAVTSPSCVAMTDAARLAEIRAALAEYGQLSPTVCRELLGLIAERDATIARLREPVRITIAGQDWAISHGDSKRER